MCKFSTELLQTIHALGEFLHPKSKNVCLPAGEGWPDNTGESSEGAPSVWMDWRQCFDKEIFFRPMRWVEYRSLSNLDLGEEQVNLHGILLMLLLPSTASAWIKNSCFSGCSGKNSSGPFSTIWRSATCVFVVFIAFSTRLPTSHCEIMFVIDTYIYIRLCLFHLFQIHLEFSLSSMHWSGHNHVSHGLSWIYTTLDVLVLALPNTILRHLDWTYLRPGVSAGSGDRGDIATGQEGEQEGSGEGC